METEEIKLFKVCAIIISYNGDEIIKNNLHCIENEVDKVIIIDNGSKNDTVSILKTIKKHHTIIYLKKNMGIAYALNEGLKYAKENSYDWIITFDQDTVPIKGSITKLLNIGVECNEKNEKYVSFGPQLIVENSRNVEKKVKRGNMKVPYLITSGNLIKVNQAVKVGGWTNNLFIDAVDYDFSLKLRKNNYKLIRCYGCLMNHTVGEKKEGRFVHNEIRKFYMIRNQKYLLKTYFKLFPIYCIYSSIMLSIEVLKWFFYEKKKRRTFNIIK